MSSELEVSVTEDHNLPDEDAGAAYSKPPSVTAELWNLIPIKMRGEFVRHAAISLIKGIHPDDAVRQLLALKGLEPLLVTTSFTQNSGPERPVSLHRPGPTPGKVGFARPPISKPQGVGFGSLKLKKIDSENIQHQNSRETFEIADTF